MMMLHVRPTVSPEQFIIERMPLANEDFDSNYISLSGYCGPIKPTTFAAAQDLLGELKRMVEHFEVFANDHSDEASSETWAALWSAKAAIDRAEGR